MITGLGHVGIFVRDLEKMVAFYREVDGLWQRVRDVALGERMPVEPATLQF
jgi:catechol 2,3-dioxygenase-like lactoylglutathione lyase family enzyme